MSRKLFSAEFNYLASEGVTIYNSQYVNLPIQSFVTLMDFNGNLLPDTRTEPPELNQTDVFKGGKPIKFIEANTVDPDLKVLTTQTLSAGSYSQMLRRVFELKSSFANVSERVVPVPAKYAYIEDATYHLYTLDNGSIVLPTYSTDVITLFGKIPKAGLKKIIIIRDTRTSSGWLTAIVLRNNGSLNYYSAQEPPLSAVQTLSATSSFRGLNFHNVQNKIVTTYSEKLLSFSIPRPSFLKIDETDINGQSFTDIKQYGNSVIALSSTGKVFRCDISTGTFTDDITNNFSEKSYVTVGSDGFPELKSGSVKLKVASFKAATTVTEPLAPSLPSVVVNWKSSGAAADERRFKEDANGSLVRDSFGVPIIEYFTPTPKYITISLRLNGTAGSHQSSYELLWGTHRLRASLNLDSQHTFPYSGLLMDTNPTLTQAVLRNPITLTGDTSSSALEINTDVSQQTGYADYVYREITIPHNATISQVETLLNSAFDIPPTSPNKFWISKQGETALIGYETGGESFLASASQSNSTDLFLKPSANPYSIRRHEYNIRVAVSENSIQNPILFKISQNSTYELPPPFLDGLSSTSGSLSKNAIQTFYPASIAEQPFKTSVASYQQSRFIWDEIILPASTTATNIFASANRYAIVLSNGSILTPERLINKTGILANATIVKVALGGLADECTIMLSSDGKVYTSGKQYLGVANVIPDKPELIYEVNFGFNFNSKIIDVAFGSSLAFALDKDGTIYHWHTEKTPSIYTSEKITNIDNLITYSSKSLPSGLTISKSGVISGKPSVSGTFNSKIKITREDLIVTDTANSTPTVTTTESYIDYVDLLIEVIEDPENSSNNNDLNIIVDTPPTSNVYKNTTGSSTSSIELFTFEVPISSLSSSSKSIDVLFSTTRESSSTPLQTYDIKLGGVSVFNSPIQLNSTSEVSASFSIEIKRSSSMSYTVQHTIIYFYGATRYTITNSKIIQRRSVPNSILSFIATNEAGLSAPINATRGEVLLT